MKAMEKAVAARRAAGLFRLESRGLVEVRGEDRTRWLQGMLSNDIAALVAGPEASGCYATLLTPKGKIVADLQVVLREDAFWLELASDAVEGVISRLDRYIIADDVTLSDQSQAYGRLGIEGPRARDILMSAGLGEVPTGADAVLEASLAGEEVAIARFGWSGELAFQLFVPKGKEQAIAELLVEAGRVHGLVEGDAETLEIMRIEAGVPRLGRELSEDVLPDEARLDRAISHTKGCYTGQEIVARLHSRGEVNHLLVGLSLSGAEASEPGAKIWAEEPQTGGEAARARPIGKLTSVCQSATAGSIALGFVRRAQAEPGTRVWLEDRSALVAHLPFEQAEVSGDGLPERLDGPVSDS